MPAHQKQPFSVRIPSDLVERLSLKAGDRVKIALDKDGKLIVRRNGNGPGARITPISRT